jgi:magnesium transporter
MARSLACCLAQSLNPCHSPTAQAGACYGFFTLPTTALNRVHPDVATKELKVYFRDVHDHALRAVSTLDLLRASAFDAMQFHMATLTLRQNDAVQKLAGWGAILAIPTVIFSLYGMNFKSMPELNWVWAYPLVILGTFIGGYWLYRRLKTRGWI